MKKHVPPSRKTSDKGGKTVGGTGPLSRIQADLVPGAPTKKVGLEVQEGGESQRYMSSDAAPALDQGISPEWTGTHNFTNQVEVPDVAQGDSSRKAANTRFVQERVAQATAGATVPAKVTYQENIANPKRKLVVIHPSFSDVDLPKQYDKFAIRFSGESGLTNCYVAQVDRQITSDGYAYIVWSEITS